MAIMRLVLVTMTVVMMAAAMNKNDPSNKFYQICGNRLSIALEEACNKHSAEYFIQHGTAVPERDHKHEHIDHHRRNRDHDHGHDHNFGRSHTQEETQEVESIVEKCCHNPCQVKEFMAFCGHKS